MNRDQVIDYLLSEAKITKEAIGRAEAIADRTSQALEKILNQLGLLSDDELAAAYAHVLDTQIWDPDRDPAMDNLSDHNLSAEFLRHAKVVPIRIEEGHLICAALDPFDEEMRSGLNFAIDMPITFWVAKSADWRKVISFGDDDIRSETFLDEQRLERDLAFVEDHGVEGQAVELVAHAFAAAIDLGASDIHFEPRRNDLMVRLRIDGRMSDYLSVSSDLTGPCVSRIKVLSNLNVGERRLPQDGRASFINAGRSVDVRVATSPTVFGETAVLRILDRAQAPQDLKSLHLRADIQTLLEKAVRTPHGLFLVTGPTGSGKTTTLYALLSAFKGSGKKILSVEDPVERHFEHVSQTQVQPGIGLSFATCLRSFLRHDPDVILVGEIRDAETAAVAVQAAMTGHLVLASVHANTAFAVAPRLNDMGIEPYQLGASLKGVMAQRLVRKLCPHCRQEVRPEAALLEFAKSQNAALPTRQFMPKGCPKCRGQGYQGRMVVSEGFWVDEALAAKLSYGTSLTDLKSQAAFAGFETMLHDGLSKVEDGLSSFEDIMWLNDA